MQMGGRRVNRDAIIRYATAALIIYGAVGVAVHLRLVSLLIEGVRGWLDLQSPSSVPLELPWLDFLHAHYDSRPWLPWAAWLVALGLLSWVAKSDSQEIIAPAGEEENIGTNPSWLKANMHWVTLGILLALILLGGYARMNQIWPQSAGISQNPYDDEGVYAGASQLFLQGILPYRDYFFAHPPIAAISYAPALLYHFNEWGSPTSFMMARYLSVAYSLLTLVLLFFIGKRLAGLWGGTLVGLLWALDGRVVEINRKVMLDGPMVLLSCAALLLYLRVRAPSEFKVQSSKFKVLDLNGSLRSTSLPTNPQIRNPKSEIRNFALVGAVAALSALTKIAGVACLLAIVADMVWVGLEGRRARKDASNQPVMRYQLLGLLGGALVAVVAVLGPFLVLAPSQFFRQVFFFQLLRPGDGLIDVPARIADLSSTLANALTPLSAALGFIALSVWVLRKRESPSNISQSKIQNPKSKIAQWRVIILWTFLSLLLFTYSRSFYGHYYIQLAAPLCLLGAGVSLIPGLSRDTVRSASVTRLQIARYAPIALLALIALPLVAVQWSGLTSRREYRIFEIVARYVNDAVPPGTPVLSTDEQFNFLAACPPSRNATGYLVDSYGHMIYLGLGLNTRDWGDLLGDVFGGKRSDDAYAAMQRPAPQADILDRATNAPLIVIHNKGFARITSETLSAIEAQVKIAEEQKDYTIYRR
jgi:4-amino-4-deoxy-L-arabinose transferase-like glycosyltransferase